MKRRGVLFLAALAAMIAVAALASRKKPGLLVLDWAAKASADTPPVAILIEMGLKDAKPSSWSGRVGVAGARVVHREGYRFRDGDKLLDPDAWKADSHPPLRPLPRNAPAVARLEPVATVGVVLHFADVKPDATLTIELQDKSREKIEVPLREVLTGQTKRLWDGGAAVRLVSAATPVATAKPENDFPAAAYGPDGSLWVAYISYTLKEESRRAEREFLKKEPDDFKEYYTPEFGDQLFVKYYHQGKWSEPLAVTGPREDLVRCAIAAEGNGNLWVIYSANRKGNHQLYARPITTNSGKEGAKDLAPRLGPEELLPAPPSPGKHLNPVACTDASGNIWVTCQRWWTGEGPQLSMYVCRDGKWSDMGISFGLGSSSWHPAITAGPNGEVTKAFDYYSDGGDYDIATHVWDGSKETGNHPIVTSSRFEARPSIAYDTQGRLWMAYEEGPEKWGKDYGALDSQEGNPLYSTRSVRVVCVVDGKLFEPAAELPTSVSRERHPNERTVRYAYPKVGLDGKGRIWLTYRQKFGSRYTTIPGSYWLTFARRLDGDHWTEPIELHHSDGLLDDRPVLLPHPSGGLLVFHNTDGRFTTPEVIHNQVYMSTLDLPGDPVEPKLIPCDPGQKDPKLTAAQKEERAAVKDMRDYRIEAGGKKLQLLRGEFHRHTEISWDGGPDGSLEDMFRYAIDAAAFDWIGNTDHDSGAGREYSWWLIQKYTDAYHVPETFTPLFSYERSVRYPDGHRNCIFAQRGVRTLPRLAPLKPSPMGPQVHPDDTKMLYRYLKELHGICASHTSATGMGTDWRDNDPAVEPVVEIYQGDRMSYEYEGAPRAGYDPKSNKLPANIGGWQPKGFINLALQKGYRFGFQCSSDHWSTHISFCIALAERHDRQAILDALRQRHCYGATDNIILDVRSEGHLMGDEFKTAAAPTLQVTVRGTQPLAAVEILKDSEVVATFKPGKRDYKGTWTDPKPTAGTHYYYVRVEQTDEQLAWASPLWIDYTP
jgi:hypothetical protein